MKKTSYIYIFLSAAIILLTWSFGRMALWAINFPTIVLLFGPTISLTICTYSSSDIKQIVSVAFIKGNAEEIHLKRGIHFYETVKIYLVISGVLDFFMGASLIGANLDDPDALGPSFDVALLSVLYSLTVFLVFVTPAKAALLRKPIELG